MSLLSWLFPAPRAREPIAQPESSGLSRMDPTHPLRHGERPNPAANAQPANRKQERMVRRELLYGVVREGMVRAGVLSSNYKFKVLSLDGRGRQFLVMVDLSRDCGITVPQLAEIEAMIAQTAKHRHDIVVTSVYWRMSEHVAVGDPKTRPAPTRSRPAELEPAPAPQNEGPATEPAPRMPERQPELMPEPAPRARFDPIGVDEVEAFKRALAAGLKNSEAVAAAASVAASAQPANGQRAGAVGFDGVAHHGPQSYTLLTGFEDTEVTADPHTAQELSGTQYGELT